MTSCVICLQLIESVREHRLCVVFFSRLNIINAVYMMSILRKSRSKMRLNNKHPRACHCTISFINRSLCVLLSTSLLCLLEFRVNCALQTLWRLIIDRANYACLFVIQSLQLFSRVIRFFKKGYAQSNEKKLRIFLKCWQ